MYKHEITQFLIFFSYVAMPQGFDMGSAFTEQPKFPIYTKNTEVRENFDQERSIHGIEGPIQGMFNL